MNATMMRFIRDDKHHLIRTRESYLGYQYLRFKCALGLMLGKEL
jgi:hypothetical protein